MRKFMIPRHPMNPPITKIYYLGENMKKIQINQCKNLKFWYSDKVGQEFLVISETDYDYHVVPKDGLWVSKKDCEEVTNDNTESQDTQ